MPFFRCIHLIYGEIPTIIYFTEVIYIMAKKVQFVETVLRDANQSLIATRLPFEKFEPMLETID